MYLLEGDAQPEKLLPISLAMYSAIINLATVGYGDIHPVTAAGKVFARTAAVSGIVFFALPVAFIATAFQHQIRRRDFIVSYAMVARVPLLRGCLGESRRLVRRRAPPLLPAPRPEAGGKGRARRCSSDS